MAVGVIDEVAVAVAVAAAEVVASPDPETVPVDEGVAGSEGDRLRVETLETSGRTAGELVGRSDGVGACVSFGVVVAAEEDTLAD